MSLVFPTFPWPTKFFCPLLHTFSYVLHSQDYEPYAQSLNLSNLLLYFKHITDSRIREYNLPFDRVVSSLTSLAAVPTFNKLECSDCLATDSRGNQTIGIFLSQASGQKPSQ